ncbi:type IV secretory system conjugative DNA transfer family protein [Candidatus Gracilibacteria bacterium]|nr:type IV secretory system conjugative DNA transfer family protein [Candidatus Gracilibacteria bacterium]
MKQQLNELTIKIPPNNELSPLNFEQILNSLSINAKQTLKLIIGKDENNKIQFKIIHDQSLNAKLNSTTQAFYPDAELENRPSEVKKINYKFQLQLSEPDFFPIKRFEQFEDKLTKTAIDPIGSIIEILEQENGKSAYLEIDLKPAPPITRPKYNRTLKLIHSNWFPQNNQLRKIFIKLYITRNLALKLILFPLFFRFFLKNLTTNFQKISLDEETKRQHSRETSLEAAIDKITKPLFLVNIKATHAKILNAFQIYNLPSSNSFVITNYKNKPKKSSFILNSEELATIYHLPQNTVKSPNLDLIRYKKLPPTNLLEKTKPQIILGKSNYRNGNQPLGLNESDRLRHLYIVGKTGMGKSTLLENLIIQDLKSGNGICLIDPHGDLADNIINYIPKNRQNDLILFDVADRANPIALNLLDNKQNQPYALIASNIVTAFKKLFAHSWGPRLEYVLRNSLIALLSSQTKHSILSLPRLLTDTKFCQKIIDQSVDPVVKNFFNLEFLPLTDKAKQEVISPILNKVGQFLSNPDMRNILGQINSSFDFRYAMDKQKIVIINLSKGKIGEDNTELLGALLVSKLQIEAMSRADLAESDRKPFYLYVDEFQNFATDSFATILSEARKYGLSLTLANQFINQMPLEVKDAVFGNVGTILNFQMGVEDSEYLAQQYNELLSPNDITNLPKYEAYSRILVSGQPQTACSLITLPTPKPTTQAANRKQKLQKLNREKYTTPKKIIEQKIIAWI